MVFHKASLFMVTGEPYMDFVCYIHVLQDFAAKVAPTLWRGHNQSVGQMFGLTRKLMYWIDICYESGILLYCSPHHQR